MAANYRYTDPVFNAMYGARTPFQIPGGLPTAHLPPRVAARRKPVRVWHPPCPDRTKPTRTEVVLRIRDLQEQGKIPNPFAHNSGFDFLPLPGIVVGASAPPAPGCSTQQACETKPRPAPEEDELEAWNRAHTFPRLPEAPSAVDLSELFRGSSRLEVTLSPSLQKPGARLAGANVLVAWNKLDLDALLNLATLMRAGDKVLISTFDASDIHIHQDAEYEVLPLANEYKPAFKRFLQAVNQLYQFLDRIAPGHMNDPDWLKDERYNDALELCRTVLDKLNTSTWTEEEQDMLDQLDKNKWKAVREVDAAIKSTIALQLPLLRERLGQALGHRNQWLYIPPELIQNLAPHRMQFQATAIVAPAGMPLDKVQPAGFMRQLDHLRSEIKADYRVELGPKLQGRANVDLAGLLIMVVIDDPFDADERAKRQTLYRRFFDPDRDQLLLLADPQEGTNCERSRGIPEDKCIYLGEFAAATQIRAGFENHLPVLTRIAEEMRRSGFAQLPDDDELKQMGTMKAAETLKLHLQSAGAAESPQGQGWLDEMQPDLRHLKSQLVQFPEKVTEWFDRIKKLHRVDRASFLETSGLMVDAMGPTLFKQFMAVSLHPKEPG